MSSAEPEPAPTRFTLRQLPLPAKLVLTVFLLTVGLGYTSAMVQLHMQHSDRDGTTLPTPENVVAVFAGKVWKNGKQDGEPRAVSPLEAIISGEKHGGLTGKNMTPAFFEKDDADYKSLAKADPQLTDARREGERRAVVAWINTSPDGRRKDYDKNAFKRPADQHKQPITPGFVATDSLGSEFVKIKDVIDTRCARCHKAGGDKSDAPLSTYEELEYLPAAEEEVPAGGGYVNSGRQMGLEKLTQSTHAHLLSFAVLFAMTGLVFAFSGFPGVVRGTVAPVVLLAQVADVSCWWLARLPGDAGPAFAKCIIGTGGVVGMGLMVQILGSLWGMYGPAGKAVLAVLFGLAVAGGGAAYVKVVDPYLKDERAKKDAAEAAAKQKAADQKAAAGKKADDTTAPAPKPIDKKSPESPPTAPAVRSWLEDVVTGPFVPKKGPWSGKKEGGMVRAFFDKEEAVFAPAQDDKSPDLPKLTEERRAEQELILAWLRSAPDARRKAYDADRFPPPAPLAGKPFTPDFKAGDGQVKVKALFDARCASCHKPGGDKEDAPMHTWAALEKYLGPRPAGK